PRLRLATVARGAAAGTKRPCRMAQPRAATQGLARGRPGGRPGGLAASAAGAASRALLDGRAARRPGRAKSAASRGRRPDRVHPLAGLQRRHYPPGQHSASVLAVAGLLGADARGGRPGDYRGAADLRRGPNELLRRGNCAVAGGRPGPVGAGGSCVVDPPYGAGWTASWAPGTSRPRTPTRALERPRRDIALVQRALLRAALPDAAGGAAGSGGGADPPLGTTAALGGRAGGRSLAGHRRGDHRPYRRGRPGAGWHVPPDWLGQSWPV